MLEGDMMMKTGCIAMAILAAVVCVFETIGAVIVMLVGNVILSWSNSPQRLDFWAALAIFVLLSLVGSMLNSK